MKDSHDELVNAYLEYFKANELFQKRGSVRTRRAARKWTKVIQKMAKLRWMDIGDEFREHSSRERYPKEENHKYITNKNKNAKQKQDKGKDV